MTHQQQLIDECDKCVMCGLCLPHCPTYTLTLDENESPRGRISLVRAVLSGQLQLSSKTQSHLDHCLSCRACERICPSAVSYSKIINGIREQSARDLPIAVSDRKALRRLNNWLWLFQKTGMQAVFRQLKLLGAGKLARKLELLPKISRQHDWQEHYPAAANTHNRGQVQLFTGCVSNSIDHQTLRDAVIMLNHLGYDVIVPPSQHCCGAMDLHHGHLDLANSLAEQNKQAFGDADIPVISLHSGCSATLKDTVDNQVLDICDFLVSENLQPAFGPYKKRIAIHSPCTKKNVLRNEQNVVSVIRHIPGAEIIELPANLSCCGAAGSYMLEYPEQADAIREPTLEAVIETKPDILLTSNIGCAMHLQAGLRKAGKNIEVLHPTNLIAKLLVRGKE